MPGLLENRARAAFGLIASVLIAWVLVALDRRDLLWEAPDRVTYDWRTWLLSDRAERPRDDIAIILINEESLTGYPYLSPIDRGLSAELVRAIADSGPKAIGLDFIIDWQTEPAKDAALIAALKEVHPRVPIVVGAIDDRSDPHNPRPEPQERLIAETGVDAGHIYFATEKNRLSLGDQAVRFLVPPSQVPPSRPSFASALARTVGVEFEPTSPLIAWRHPPREAGAHLVPTFTVPPHRDAAGNRTGEVLPANWRDALKDKIVLVGGAFSDRDRHLTPLAVATDQRVHGVEIHAQILAQYLDRRSITLLNEVQEGLLVFLVAAIGFVIGARWKLSGGEIRSSVFAFFVFVSLSFGLFWAFDLILPTATLFFAWPLGLFAGNRAEWITERFWHSRTYSRRV